MAILLAAVAELLALIVVAFVYYMLRPVWFDGFGKLGTVALLTPLVMLLMAAGYAVLGVLFLLATPSNVPGTILFGAAVLASLMVVWSFTAQLLRARRYRVHVSVVPALGFTRNAPATGSDFETVEAGPLADGSYLEMDVWRPDDDPSSPLPAIVRINGSAWDHGDKGRLARWDEWFAERGFVVFDVGYRTPPPFISWNTEIGDVKYALGYVARHARQYGIDPRRITLAGYSAGGNLSLLAAYSMHSKELPPSGPVRPVPVKAVIDIYSPVAMVPFLRTTGSKTYVADALNRYIGGPPSAYPERYRALSPITYVGPKAPPTLSIVGEHDRFVPVDQVRLLDRTLREHHVHHEMYTIPFQDHGFDLNWNSIGTQIAREKIGRFLDAYAS